MDQNGTDRRSFAFSKTNQHERKPRRHGITEIRGPYYTAIDKHYLEMWRGFGPETTITVQTYTIGTLVLDMYDANTKRLIWRGTATDTLSEKPEKNENKLNKAIKQWTRGGRKMKRMAPRQSCRQWILFKNAAHRGSPRKFFSRGSTLVSIKPRPASRNANGNEIDSRFSLIRNMMLNPTPDEKCSL
jgi:hypothetical protein